MLVISIAFFILGKKPMSMTVAEAGKKGGLSVAKQYGRAFFSSIGRRGQRAQRSKYPEMAKEWGKMGGRPRKPALKA